MITEIQFYVLLAVIVVVWLILLLLGGVPLHPALIGPFTTVPTIVLLFLAVFNRWLWKSSWLHPWLVPTPDLTGTWKGHFESDYIPEGSAPATPGTSGEAFLVVRQTFSTIHSRLLTDESQSESLVCRVVRADDGTHALMAAFRNTPRPQFRGRSAPHYGGLLLRVLGDHDPALEGEYWTSRKTVGELTFRLRNKVPVDDLERARLLGYLKPKG